MAKVRIADIATKAGVGTATVERVLNARGSVSVKTARKVIVAAKILGYNRLLPQTYRGIIRIEVILIRPDTSFYRRLGDAYARIAPVLDRSIHLHRTYVNESDIREITRTISNSRIARSGLIIVAPDQPEIAECLEREQEKGTEIVTVVSGISTKHPLPHVGIDNYAAGRTAAHLMDRMAPRGVRNFIALCHSGAFPVQTERVRGFTDYFLEQATLTSDVSKVIFMQDDKFFCETALREEFSRNIQITGIYNAGGATIAVANVLKAFGKQNSVLWVGHEFTTLSHELLKANTMDIVIDQNPNYQAQHSVNLILSHIGFTDDNTFNEPIQFQIMTRENRKNTPHYA